MRDAISLVTRSLPSSTAPSRRDDVRRLHRRVLEPEELEQRLALGEVETGDRDEPVGGLEAPVVRVHRDAAGDLGGPRLQVVACRRPGRPVELARQPDEVLHLHSHRRGEQRDVDALPDARLAGAHQRCEHGRREQEPGGEVGHRDAAGTHRHPVSRRGVRGEQAGAGLRDEVVRRHAGERACFPERRHDAEHETGMAAVDRLPAEAERLGARRRRVVERHVRRGEQRLQPLPPDSVFRSSTTDRLPRLSGTKSLPSPGATGITCR